MLALCVVHESAYCGLQASSLLLGSCPQEQPPAASLCQSQPHLVMASLRLHSRLHLPTARVPQVASLQLHSPLHLATAKVPWVASLQLLPREPVQHPSRPLALLPAHQRLGSRLLVADPSLSDAPLHAIHCSSQIKRDTEIQAEL